MCMPKRTLDQVRYWSQTNKLIDERLREYYRAYTVEELPTRLRQALKNLDEEIEPSAKQVEVIRDIES